ncbi:apyrase and calcium-activated nucleotidase SCAN-1-like protein [Cryptosporidium canis]|uniref:Apyrase and calcium-activated nucleotidase SCAN-1-like protein n=1 Tax=Cryptosporidium canis TaxID=195482 RepID=A0A9D5DR67_9CRYT|nr:apyrase and calcium-activated nucleotidase SCAN-1-like protein [Cryptosporidium canis]
MRVLMAFYCIGIFATILHNVVSQSILLSLGNRSTQGRQICTLESCNFRLVADLDLKSRPKHGEKSYKSRFQKGSITQDSDGNYNVSWGENVELNSGYNEFGRGMELSELISFNGMMLSGDDRTGIIFEIIGDGEGVAPRYILSEGNGKTSKGMKIEWMAVRDGILWVGSFGKEFVSNGVIEKRDNMWVATIDKRGSISRFNWSSVYDKIRNSLGTQYPGYCIHEAVAWSHLMRKWIFLPRRVSFYEYDEEKDEKRGSNKMIILSDDLEVLEVIEVGSIIPERGFSSLKFLPGSFDQIIVAIKSVEDSKNNLQKSFITIFTINGEVLLDDLEVPGNYKYEGIEFV